MKPNKTVITDITSYYLSWFSRVIAVIITVGLYLELLSLVDFESFTFTTELAVHLFFFVLIAVYSIKIFLDFSSITKLSFSNSGIHSKKETVKWESISKLYFKVKSGLPVLFVEYKQNEKVYFLKTVLKIHKGKRSFEKIQSQLQHHQNT